MRRALRAFVLASVVSGLAIFVPATHADADCTDLGGQGQLCTVGDPSAGNFGVGLHAGIVNACIVIFQTCP